MIWLCYWQPSLTVFHLKEMVEERWKKLGRVSRGSEPQWPALFCTPIHSRSASNWCVCRDGNYCPRMLHACQVIADGYWSLEGKWSAPAVVAAAIDKDINFYCTPVFYLSPFSIENLGRFGALGSLASKLKRGQTWPSFVWAQITFEMFNSSGLMPGVLGILLQLKC